MNQVFNIEPGLMSGASLGLASGLAVAVWHQKSRAEERCEFLGYVGEDLKNALFDADDILSSDQTPKSVRKVILHLLAAYADEKNARRFVAFFIDSSRKHEVDRSRDSDNILLHEMDALSKENSELARKAHRVMASLYFSLIILNLSDHLKIEKVQDDVARDPSSLWGWISRTFKNTDDSSDISTRGVKHV